MRALKTHSLVWESEERRGVFGLSGGESFPWASRGSRGQIEGEIALAPRKKRVVGLF
jgi:hypothetical protein